ncbi:MAG: thioredoxin domain-containing protein [Patescibacteria group bacterium]
MTENQSNLSPKELYEQEREARQKQKNSNSSASASSGGNSGRKLWPWLLAVLILAGTVFGLYKLATVTPPGAGAVAGKLADPVTAADWTAGSQESPVQLVEYGDFQCPACAFYATWVTQLREEFGDKIGVTFRHFPLRQNHANAQLASQVVEAAGLQGKFWLAADAIYAGQQAWSEQIAARETLVNLIKNTGVNLTKLEVDIDTKIVKDKIEQHYQSGLRSGVEGTPTFYLNGGKITNPKSYDEFKKLITDALSA